MGSFSEILKEVKPELEKKNVKYLHDKRLAKIVELSNHTKRNVISYYSNYLKINQADVAINDKDKNAFMSTIHKMDRSKGLDIILHTPGGDLAATESIVDYLYQMFGTNIRAIIPQIAMSAGTMIALSCNKVLMGKHSNLGPIDPQLRGVPCQSLIEEFTQAKEEIRSAPWSTPLWQTIISKYNPTFLIECQHAIKWSEELALDWLQRNMCNGDNKKAKEILKGFSSHKDHKSHGRHISSTKCKELGLDIIDLESDPILQDLVLSIHHCYTITLDLMPMLKIVENNLGTSWVQMQAQPIQIPIQALQNPPQGNFPPPFSAH